MSHQGAKIALKHPDRFFIGGEWVVPQSSGTFDVICSATEEVVARVAEANEADVHAAVTAARDAFDNGPWPRMSHAQRANYMRAMAAAFLRRSDEFARIWTHESGILYSMSSARIGVWLAGAFNQYADMAETFGFSEPRVSAAGLKALLVREPVGVVAAIIPWNGPAGLLAYKSAPALLAGCTLVVKSSPEAPCSGNLFAEICEEVALPAGVVNVVAADRGASESLVADPRIDKVTFTGSTQAGRAIGAACAQRMARCTLELGGKSPAIVLDDYDIEGAAQTLACGVNYLTGQVCHSLTRIIVPRSHHDQMVEALVAQIEPMVIGDPFDPATQVGPLATSRQREQVEWFIARAQEEGANLACGGSRPTHLGRGFFIRPTVFGNVDNRSTIGQQEIFGPVLSVIAADNEAHAVELANDTIFGLNAAVFTNSADRFFNVARSIRSGTVGHNGTRTDFTLAFGGFKQSGIGREGGTEGLLPFLETKAVVFDAPAAAN